MHTHAHEQSNHEENATHFTGHNVIEGDVQTQVAVVESPEAAQLEYLAEVKKRKAELAAQKKEIDEEHRKALEATKAAREAEKERKATEAKLRAVEAENQWRKNHQERVEKQEEKVQEAQDKLAAIIEEGNNYRNGLPRPRFGSKGAKIWELVESYIGDDDADGAKGEFPSLETIKAAAEADPETFANMNTVVGEYYSCKRWNRGEDDMSGEKIFEDKTAEETATE